MKEKTMSTTWKQDWHKQDRLFALSLTLTLLHVYLLLEQSTYDPVTWL